jgi:outer membrane protein OmpA-like peptidoglycan-associated protein
MLFSKTTFFKTLIITVLLNNQVLAEDQPMLFDNPVSAQEMGKILFAPEEPKTRSIHFVKSKKVSNQTQQVAIESNSIGLPIKFALNSSRILPESRPFVEEIGKMLNIAEFSQEKLLIEGHTDASGMRSYNQKLSEKRSQAIKDYLVTNYQIDPERLSTLGRGEDRPIRGSNPYAGVNRRVQFYKAQ